MTLNIEELWVSASEKVAYPAVDVLSKLYEKK